MTRQPIGPPTGEESGKSGRTHDSPSKGSPRRQDENGHAFESHLPEPYWVDQDGYEYPADTIDLETAHRNQLILVGVLA